MAYHRKPRSSTSGSSYNTGRSASHGSSTSRPSRQQKARAQQEQQPRRHTKKMPENAKQGRKRQYGGANYQRSANRHSSIRLGKSIYPDSSEQRRYQQSRTRYEEDRERWERKPSRFDLGDMRPLIIRLAIIVILLIVLVARFASFSPSIAQMHQLDEQVSMSRGAYSESSEESANMQQKLESMDKVISKYDERKAVLGG